MLDYMYIISVAPNLILELDSTFVINLPLSDIHMEDFVRIIIHLPVFNHQLSCRGCGVQKLLKLFVRDGVVKGHIDSGADRHSSQETDVVQMHQSFGN